MTNSQYIAHKTVRVPGATVTLTLIREAEGFVIRQMWRGDGGCHLRGADRGPYHDEQRARGILSQEAALVTAA